MINEKENPVEWSQLVLELTDAHEHLGALIDEMTKNGQIEIEKYAVDLGHVFAHLNRSWNSRNHSGDSCSPENTELSIYPTDLKPVG